MAKTINSELSVISGASLVSVEDPVESQFIRQNLEILQDEVNSFWIGMHRSHTGQNKTCVNLNHILIFIHIEQKHNVIVCHRSVDVDW